MHLAPETVSLKNGKTAVFRAAEPDDAPGNCTLTPKGARRKICHRADVSIALRKAYWGLGLGKALLTRVLTLAKELGYEQVELEVISGNDRALRLYERLGFVQTGRTPRAFRYDDGSFRDEIQMVLRL